MERAVEITGQCSMRWCWAHALMSWAILLASDNQYLRARDLLEEGRDEFDDMGVPVYVEEVHAHLKALPPFVE
jgi:hypothetical protein